jgi:hypothetical protein
MRIYVIRERKSVMYLGPRPDDRSDDLWWTGSGWSTDPRRAAVYPDRLAAETEGWARCGARLWGVEAFWVDVGRHPGAGLTDPVPRPGRPDSPTGPDRRRPGRGRPDRPVAGRTPRSP